MATWKARFRLHVCGSMVDIQSTAAEIRRGKKKRRKKKKEITKQKYNGLPYSRATTIRSILQIYVRGASSLFHAPGPGGTMIRPCINFLSSFNVGKIERKPRKNEIQISHCPMQLRRPAAAVSSSSHSKCHSCLLYTSDAADE